MRYYYDTSTPPSLSLSSPLASRYPPYPHRQPICTSLLQFHPILPRSLSKYANLPSFFPYNTNTFISRSDTRSSLRLRNDSHSSSSSSHQSFSVPYNRFIRFDLNCRVDVLILTPLFPCDRTTSVSRSAIRSSFRLRRTSTKAFKPEYRSFAHSVS